MNSENTKKDNGQETGGGGGVRIQGSRVGIAVSTVRLRKPKVLALHDRQRYELSTFRRQDTARTDGCGGKAVEQRLPYATGTTHNARTIELVYARNHEKHVDFHHEAVVPRVRVLFSRNDLSLIHI